MKQKSRVKRQMIILLVTLVFIQMSCCESIEPQNKLLNVLLKSTQMKPSMANSVAKLEPRGADPFSPRFIFDFLTDPSLVVTILHTLEVAYWTLPLGFLLMPIMNFFRVPNRRTTRFKRKTHHYINDNIALVVQDFHDLLRKSVNTYRKLKANEINDFSKYNNLNKL